MRLRVKSRNSVTVILLAWLLTSLFLNIPDCLLPGIRGKKIYNYNSYFPIFDHVATFTACLKTKKTQHA